MELIEAHVAIKDVGELGEKLFAHALGLVEPAGVDEIERAI
jgi:hypothetical protein